MVFISFETLGINTWKKKVSYRLSVKYVRSYTPLIKVETSNFIIPFTTPCIVDKNSQDCFFRVQSDPKYSSCLPMKTLFLLAYRNSFHHHCLLSKFCRSLCIYNDYLRHKIHSTCESGLSCWAIHLIGFGVICHLLLMIVNHQNRNFGITIWKPVTFILNSVYCSIAFPASKMETRAHTEWSSLWHVAVSDGSGGMQAPLLRFPPTLPDQQTRINWQGWLFITMKCRAGNAKEVFLCKGWYFSWWVK